MELRGWGRHALLLGLLLVLIGVVWVSSQKAPEPQKKLLTVDIAALDRIVIDNGEHLELQKGDRGWQLNVPFRAPVSQARVDQLIEIAAVVPRSEYPLPAPETLGDFGLAPPSIRLALGTSVLGFGVTAPLDRSRYVAHEGRLFLIEDRFYYALSAKAADFVEKKLVPGQSSIRGLSLPGFTLSQSEAGAWRSMPPLDEAGRTDLLTHWQLARALEIRHESHPGLIAETVEIEVDPQRLRFLVLSKSPELILYREDLELAYVMPPEAAKSLLEWRTVSEANDSEPDPGHRDLNAPQSEDRLSAP